ncbi:MAG: cupin domain-containing protein [Pseudomonadota bacterium]
MHFSDFDTGAFLRDHWQKEPLLIRSPWDTWANPLDPDELAGLACEAEVESRLVTQRKGEWIAEHGPFPETRLRELGAEPWTLLVQAVDHYDPAVAALIEPFRFIPNWRIDDVMVSCAADGGGVGPHFDQYDVFLIQGRGKRRWQTGARCDAASPLMPHDELRLLAEFEAVEDWVLEPGDILYIPPGVAHNGVAVGDNCMTYSIGFRAPSRAELIAHWADHLLETLPDEDRYEDPDLRAQDNPGAISDAAIGRLHMIVAETLNDRDGFARWFGEYCSTPKYPEIDWRPERAITVATLREWVAANTLLRRNPASRFSYIRQGADSVTLFADGRSFACTDGTVAFVETLCAQTRIVLEADLVNSDDVLALTAELFNQGSLVREPED